MGFSVDDGFEDMESQDIDRIAREEVFKAAINTQNTWKELLDRAEWRNTGEGIESINIEPQTQGALEYTVGSEKIQIAIAEFGRAPGSTPPPPEPIADWVNEQAGLPNKGDEDFKNTVYNVQMSIAEKGIEPIRAGRNAFSQESENAEQRLEERLSE
jgi:hypothetical protein